MCVKKKNSDTIMTLKTVRSSIWQSDLYESSMEIGERSWFLTDCMKALQAFMEAFGVICMKALWKIVKAHNFR